MNLHVKNYKNSAEKFSILENSVLKALIFPSMLFEKHRKKKKRLLLHFLMIFVAMHFQHGGIFPRPKTHWRERHEEFIGAVSGAKHVERALKTGGPLPPPPKTSFNPDYVKCDYCGRNFNQRAAERHVPFCREQNARTAKAPKTGSGKAPRVRYSFFSRVHLIENVHKINMIRKYL